MSLGVTSCTSPTPTQSHESACKIANKATSQLLTSLFVELPGLVDNRETAVRRLHSSASRYLKNVALITNPTVKAGVATTSKNLDTLLARIDSAAQTAGKGTPDLSSVQDAANTLNTNWHRHVAPICSGLSE